MNMSLEKVLENWEEYDNKKLKGVDARYFSCEETWEVTYLTEKIFKSYNGVTKLAIQQAIMACCKTVAAPRPRKEFVKCILQRLGLILS
ncbi:MAG: hypothetical protein EBR30_06500 [Cytophagia bacterium]|nr:hypothetical protein [Cytophagia bacterium]NBW34661.1 hypothetical protein [Cytophagia bacterium]